MTSTSTDRRSAFLRGAARGIALFLGGFSLLNLLGELRSPRFDANPWWIDLRPLPILAGRALLLLDAVLLVAFALRPPTSPWRRRLSRAAILVLVSFALWNTIVFYLLVARGSVSAGLPVPLSLLVAAGLLLVLLALRGKGPGVMTRREALAGAAFLGGCLVGFPLAQMYCFGKTDYRRPADAVVVLGARTHTDGRPSDALADRVRTGVQIFHDGLVPLLVFSGGPGDGPVHETEAMRRMALDLGVPEKAIVLDTGGLNTQETARNTARLFARLGCRRVLVVSHFYHLPRLKMAYQREGMEVFTVPAKESYFLTWMPYYLLREVAALWVYYLRSLAHRRGYDEPIATSWMCNQR